MLIVFKLALGAFSWHRGGLLYWLVAGPLVMGFFAAGPPWLALAARDLVRNRRLVWRDAGPWLLVLVASLALGFAIAGDSGSWTDQRLETQTPFDKEAKYRGTP